MFASKKMRKIALMITDVMKAETSGSAFAHYPTLPSPTELRHLSLHRSVREVMKIVKSRKTETRGKKLLRISLCLW